MCRRSWGEPHWTLQHRLKPRQSERSFRFALDRLQRHHRLRLCILIIKYTQTHTHTSTQCKQKQEKRLEAKSQCKRELELQWQWEWERPPISRELTTTPSNQSCTHRAQAAVAGVWLENVNKPKRRRRRGRSCTARLQMIQTRFSSSRRLFSLLSVCVPPHFTIPKSHTRTAAVSRAIITTCNPRTRAPLWVDDQTHWHRIDPCEWKTGRGSEWMEEEEEKEEEKEERERERGRENKKEERGARFTNLTLGSRKRKKKRKIQVQQRNVPLVVCRFSSSSSSCCNCFSSSSAFFLAFFFSFFFLFLDMLDVMGVCSSLGAVLTAMHQEKVINIERQRRRRNKTKQESL